jgi:hypothetical protein
MFCLIGFKHRKTGLYKVQNCASGEGGDGGGWNEKKTEPKEAR